MAHIYFFLYVSSIFVTPAYIYKSNLAMYQPRERPWKHEALPSLSQRQTPGIEDHHCEMPAVVLPLRTAEGNMTSKGLW